MYADGADRVSGAPGQLGASRAALVAGCTILMAWSGVAGQARADDGLSNLRRRLDQILDDHKQPGVRLGAMVVELPGRRVLYARDAGTAMIPASNMKLIVIAAAIDRLGLDFRFKTVLAIHNDDLVVIGGGDPTIGDERLAKAGGRTITSLFHTWAAKLEQAGVRQIPGDLVVDDSVFDLQFVHPNWPRDQFQAWYEAPIGGLNFNANCASVEVTPARGRRPARLALVPGNTYLELQDKTRRGGKRTAVVNRNRDSDVLVVTGAIRKAGVLGPITVRDPGVYFGSVLKTVLAAKGIRVHGAVVRRRVRLDDGRLPHDCHLVDVHRGSILDAAGRAGRNSLGMAAEGLIKTLGADFRGRGNWPNGVAAVGRFMDKVGVRSDQYLIDDGSGLSRRNRLSAAAAVNVLGHVFRVGGRTFEAFRDSLARAGIDGSLRNRLKSGDVKGRVFAKTGYINGVRTLAGYIHTGADRWLAFAFFYNQAAATRPLTRAQDRACRLLVRWPDDLPGK